MKRIAIIAGSVQSRILGLLFFISFLVLVFQAHAQFKEVIDEWFLDGIFVYFVIFALAYCLVAVNSSSLEKVTVLSSFFLLAIVLVPNLKYYFTDAFDSMAHYGSIKETIKQGYVINTGPYEIPYKYAVLSRILIAEISLMLHLDALMSIKLFMVVSAFLFPLLVYLVSKRLRLPKDVSINAVILSILSFSTNAYIFAGTYFVQPIYVSFIYLLILYAISSFNNVRVNMFIIICVFGFALIFFHDSTTFITLLLLILMFFISVLSTKNSKIPFLFWVAAFLIYFIYLSNFNLTFMVEFLVQQWNILLKGSELPTLTYYSTFFQLPLMDQIKILVVNFANYATLSLLSIVGIIVLTKKKLPNLRSSNSKYIAFYYLIISIFIFGVITFLVGYLAWRISYRMFYNVRFTLPFLSALAISFFQQKFPKNTKKIFTLFVLFILIFVSILQIFPYQPLIPKESVKDRSFPVQEHRSIVTIYQRSTLNFLNTYNERFYMSLEDSIRWIGYALIDSHKQKLIVSTDPIIYNVKPSEQSLVVVSPSSRANYIIYSYADAVMNYFLDVNQNYSLLYTNGEWYVFGNA
jgi:hypothetical protein